MTLHATLPPNGTTQAAEGLPRRRFTVADVERMVEVGLMEEDERVELIGGELVPMAPKGNHHEVVKTALLLRWYRACPDDLLLTPETTFRLSTDTYLEPDVVVYRRSDGLKNLTAERLSSWWRSPIPRSPTISGGRRRSTRASASGNSG